MLTFVSYCNYWNMNLKSLFVVSVVAAIAVSCAAPANISYFQDADQYGLSLPVQENHIRLRPEDKVSIIVNVPTADEDLMKLFNLPYVSQRLGSSNTSMSAISGYLVDEEGNIDFPVLGKIQVSGMTRPELAAHIKQQLMARELAKDPVVTVEFMNLTFSVMGEVGRPGRYSIDKDKLTLFDALSQAGDLTIYGNRDNVKVFRIVDGKQTSFKVDLCSAQSVISSPVYYLQQDDLVYVEPNEMRARQSTVNGNNVRSTSFWISIASLAASVGTFLLRASAAAK